MKSLLLILLAIGFASCETSSSKHLASVNDSLSTRLTQELEFIDQQQKQLDFMKEMHAKEIHGLKVEIERIKDQTELGRMLKSQEELKNAQMKEALKKMKAYQEKIGELEQKLIKCEQGK